MKRLIAAGVLIIFVVSTYLTGYFYIKNTCDTANALLKDCIEIYKTDKDATKSAKKLNDFWSKNEPLLSVFANHSSIDEIELAISSLENYSDSPDNKIFYEYSSTVETLIHQLMEDTKPSMHSIL